MTRSGWQKRYMEHFYSTARGFVDGTTEFHALCARYIPAGSRILEIGAGPTNATTTFLATLGEVHGADPDPDMRNNSWLKTATVLTGSTLPYSDRSFDACVSNYVVEHIADPVEHLKEVSRVLRPEGVYVFRTPNRFHYVSLAASLLPHGIHVAVANRLRGLSDEAHEPYPTYYRMNTRAAVRRAAARCGVNVERIDMVEKEPSYGMSSRCLFLTFMLWERAVNSTTLGSGLRTNMFIVVRQPGGTSNVPQ